MAKYSAMSIENRFDRWMSERDLKETVGKSYEDYKEALRNTPNNWFTDEKGQIFKHFYLIFVTVSNFQDKSINFMFFSNRKMAKRWAQKIRRRDF